MSPTFGLLGMKAADNDTHDNVKIYFRKRFTEAIPITFH